MKPAFVFGGGLLLAALAVATSAAASPPVGRDALLRLTARGLRVSAELYDLDRHRPLAAFTPGQRLTPASLSKLYVAVAALRRWPADHRFTTRLYEFGPLRPGGVLEGGLVLRGGGDPTLTYARLARLALAAAALGIRRTTLPLVIVPGRLVPVPCAPRDRCRARQRARAAYLAPLSPLEVDYGTYDLLVRPGRRAGLPAAVTLLPFPLRGVRLIDRVRTVRAGESAFLTAHRVSGRQGTRITVNGAIARRSPPHHLYVAAGRPGRLAARLFRGLLRRVGVHVPAGFARRPHLPPGARLLVAVRGESLARILHAMVAYSNNVIADLLTLDWARSVRGHPPASLDEASRTLARSLAPLLLRYGARRPPRLLSGSGLSVGNRSSARELVALLRAGYARTASFPTLLGSLALPGQTPMRFIDDPTDTVWEDRVAVKTGTLTTPYAVVGLAGYLRLARGGWGAFAVLVNGTPRHPSVSVGTVLTAVRRFLAPDLKRTARPVRP